MDRTLLVVVIVFIIAFIFNNFRYKRKYPEKDKINNITLIMGLLGAFIFIIYALYI